MSWLPGCKQASRDGYCHFFRQHRSFMSIKSFVQHSGWQEMVSLCSLIRLIGVCADRDQPEFLCSRSDSRYLGVHVATAGGCQRLLTHYRWCEVRNSIHRYREIYIDYRSKFSYRFISSISIIYGNTNYRPSEVRNSIYRYRKIHIDYRSRFSYWFIATISIIYSNTTSSIPYQALCIISKLSVNSNWS